MLYLTPLGTPNSLGQRYWKGTAACCDFLHVGPDDSAYIRSLMDEISSKYTVDQKRIYVAGLSNGGFMAQRLACDHSSKIAAMVSVSAVVEYDQSLCQPNQKLSVLTVHGTQDTTVKFDGGTLFGGSYPSATDTFKFWASKNGCSTTATEGTAFDLDGSLAGSETIPYSATSCPSGIDVNFWKVIDGGHNPRLKSDIPQKIITFLLNHPKPI